MRPVPKSLVAAALACLAARPARAERDAWWGRDKALHLGVSFALASGGYAVGAAISREPVVRFGIGGSVALGAGIAKEMYDRTGAGTPSLRDLSWDAIGVATGLLASWLLERAFKR
jgi:putative lipoprotein